MNGCRSWYSVARRPNEPLAAGDAGARSDLLSTLVSESGALVLRPRA